MLVYTLVSFPIFHFLYIQHMENGWMFLLYWNTVSCTLTQNNVEVPPSLAREVLSWRMFEKRDAKTLFPSVNLCGQLKKFIKQFIKMLQCETAIEIVAFTAPHTWTSAEQNTLSINELNSMHYSVRNEASQRRVVYCTDYCRRTEPPKSHSQQLWTS